jgi:hypothetical protein
MTERHRDGAKTNRNLDMPDASLKISSRHYQRLVSKIEGKPRNGS